MTNPQRYPLEWPIGVPRQQFREAGRFKRGITLAEAIKEVLAELRRARVFSTDVFISTNVRVRLDGLPYSGERPMNGDPGVAVYWRKNDQLHAMAIDRYTSVEANLHAIALSIDALRAMERYGTKQMSDRAFGGFAALPAKASASSWRAMLGLENEKHIGFDTVERAYRKALLTAHPDHGGSTEAMSRLTEARADALRELREG